MAKLRKIIKNRKKIWPMVLIKNRQKKIPVNSAKLRKNCQNLLNFLKYDDFDLGIWLTTNKMIRIYNKRFRKNDNPTNILSFPFHTNLKAGKRIIPKSEEDKNLGDLIISLEFVKNEASTLEKSINEHLTTLIVHGVAHLLGFDHTTPKEYLSMKKFEQKLLAKLSK